MDYLKKHQESGLKVGDKVKLIRKSFIGEYGWNVYWNSSLMNKNIGKFGEIIQDADDRGFVIRFKGSEDYFYPYFVLEKVNITEYKYTCKNKTEVAALFAAARENGFKKICDDYDNNYTTFLINIKSKYCGMIGDDSIISKYITSISLLEMLDILSKPVKSLPEPVQIGDGSHELNYIVENDIITAVKVGCKTIPVTQIEELLNRINRYNKEII